ncbi:MAG: lytic transglycosylase domain-containing protein [Mitsuokella sp.]
MIDFAGIRQVQMRIAAIQEQFGMPGGVPGMAFQRKLDSEIEKAKGVRGADAAAAHRDAAQDAAPKALRAAGAKGTTEALPIADKPLADLVREASAKFGVDPKLVSAVAEVESGGNQNAVSGAGAVGVMQLMPETAAGLGVNPYDERENVEGGAKYIKEMLDTFGGDVKKAVAAYNAGPQAVKDYGGVPPYRETQNYVNKVLDIYQ